MNCYELDNTSNYETEGENDYQRLWTHPLICHGVFFPSTYYTTFNNYGYLMVNSELTVDSCKGLFKAFQQSTSGTSTYNLYTGYLENSSIIDSNNESYSFK